MTDPVENMLAGVQRAKSSYQPKRPENLRIGFIAPPEFISLVDRAAEARGISKNAFIQRSIAAMACATLGLDYYDFMEDAKAPPARTYHPVEKETRAGRKRIRRVTIQGSAGGKGAGLWRIRGLD